MSKIVQNLRKSFMHAPLGSAECPVGPFVEDHFSDLFWVLIVTLIRNILHFFLLFTDSHITFMDTMDKFHPKITTVHNLQIIHNCSQIAKVDLGSDLFKSHQILHLTLQMEVKFSCGVFILPVQICIEMNGTIMKKNRQTV